MPKEIQITFKDGTVKIQTKGFSGGACKTATKGLKAALGEVTDEKDTAEACGTTSTNIGNVKQG